MKNFKTILFLTILLFSFSLLFSACDTPPPKKIQKNQNVVTKKIIQPDQKESVDQTKTQQDKKPAEVKTPEPVQKPAKVKTPEPVQKPAEVKTPEPVQKPAKVEKPKPELNNDQTSKDKQTTDSNNLSINNKLKDEMEEDKTKKYFYVSAGKIDPFLSPIRKNIEQKRNKLLNRKHTPLEKLDLSQLKLVAIIKMQSGKKDVAMVQESSGKGYMVKVGTYIGTNNGRIVKIKNDEIIIKESIKNFRGIFEDRLKEMKLQKKSDG